MKAATFTLMLAVGCTPKTLDVTRSNATDTPQPDSEILIATVRAAAETFEPPEPGPSPVVGMVPEGRRHVRRIWDIRFDLPTPEPVESFDMVFQRLPWARLAPDGTLTVRWETRTPTPPGLLYIGQRVEEDSFAMPRYRKATREPGVTSNTIHEASLGIGDLFSPNLDINGIARRGWGEVAWRVEVFDDVRGTTRMFDSRTALRREPDATIIALPTVVLGPFVDQVDEDSAIVSFDTDVPTVSVVGVGNLPPRTSETRATHHEISLDHLVPGNSYAYQVAVSDGKETSVTPISTFRTHDPAAPVRLAFLSDSRAGTASGLEGYEGVNALVLHELVVRAARDGVDAIVFPGDLIDGYVTSPDVFDFQLQTWLKVVEGVHGSVPIYEGMGNHESLVDAWTDHVEIDKSGDDSAEAHFGRMFVNPKNGPPPEREGAPPYDEVTYSFDVGDVHVAVLHTSYWWASDPTQARLGGRGNKMGMIMDTQMAWLETDLADAQQNGARHLIVTSHQPAFPVGGHIGDGMWWDNADPAMNAMRERFWKILGANRVLAYVAGHEHNFSRTLIGADVVPGVENPVWSIITGGAGAPYYAENPPPEYGADVKAFSSQQHYTLWTFEKHAVHLQAIGITGQIIDDVWLQD